MRRTDRGTNAGELVEAVRRAGGGFVQTEGGCWLIQGVNALPCHLKDELLTADEKALAGFLRQERERQEKPDQARSFHGA